MPIAVTCQCGKPLQVRDELAGKAVKCPACQQVVRVPATSTSAARPAATARPAPVVPKPAPASAPRSAPLAQPSAIDHLFEEAGLTVKTGQFCPECMEPLRPGAVLCTHCGYHIETGAKLQGHKTIIESEDSAEAALKRAEHHMARARELDEKLQNAGMPAWMMAMILFILASCTTVGVIAVNVSRRGKDSTVSFNAVATMLMLAGIAFAAVAVGSQCLVLYRAFRESPKQGMFVLLIPFYVFYYAVSRFRKVGWAVIVCVLTSAVATGLFIMAGMSNAGTL